MSSFNKSVQIRVFEEELSIVASKSEEDKVSMQVALSKIIREWELAKNVKEHSEGGT
tara:strand:- start:432 stop:602 length:171 start_codon:yes stop_codon:yes gene_type:complete